MRKLFIIMLILGISIKTSIAMLPTTPKTIVNQFVKINKESKKIEIETRVLAYPVNSNNVERAFPQIISEYDLKIINKDGISIIDNKKESNLLNIYSYEKDKVDKKVNIYTLKNDYIKNGSTLYAITHNNDRTELHYTFSDKTFAPFGGTPFIIRYE